MAQFLDVLVWGVLAAIGSVMAGRSLASHGEWALTAFGMWLLVWVRIAAWAFVW